VFFLCLFNCNTAFKITNALKVDIDNFKFNNDFKSHVTIEMTPKKH
jgi:hypothetical protein